MRTVSVTLLIVLCLCSPVMSFSQGEPVDSGIPQQIPDSYPNGFPLLQHKIIVDGHRAVGIFQKDSEGTVQVVTCPEPIRWSSTDRTEVGWACYEASVRVWIMNALPPRPVQTVRNEPVMAPPQQAQQQPVYQQAPYPPFVYVPVQEVYRPVIGGVGEVVILQPYPVYSSRVVITRDAIRTGGRVLESVYRRRR